MMLTWSNVMPSSPVSVSPKRIEGLKHHWWLVDLRALTGRFSIAYADRSIAAWLRSPRSPRSPPVSVSPKRIEGLKRGVCGQQVDVFTAFQYPLSGSKD